MITSAIPPRSLMHSIHDLTCLASRFSWLTPSPDATFGIVMDLSKLSSVLRSRSTLCRPCIWSVVPDTARQLFPELLKLGQELRVKRLSVTSSNPSDPSGIALPESESLLSVHEFRCLQSGFPLVSAFLAVLESPLAKCTDCLPQDDPVAIAELSCGVVFF